MGFHKSGMVIVNVSPRALLESIDLIINISLVNIFIVIFIIQL
jgi:hypothetical protein